LRINSIQGSTLFHEKELKDIKNTFQEIKPKADCSRVVIVFLKHFVHLKMSLKI